LRSVALVASLLLVVGCGEDEGATARHDLAASGDLAAPSGVGDLGPDLSACVPRMFLGFFGTSDTPRSLDCTCGCVIDSFDGQFVASYWGNPHTTNAVFQGQPGTGLALTLTHAPGAGVESGGLNSFSPVAPFFLAGDFDVLVDYKLLTPLPPDTHLVLGVQPKLGSDSVERARAADGSDQVAANLGGALVTQASAATAGTLELQRTGGTVAALVDGIKVAQSVGGALEPVALTLAGAIASCSVDGGASCSATLVWHNLRMKSGSLVDRR
jgi:hypothetical protein